MTRRRVLTLLVASWLAVCRATSPVPFQPLTEVQIDAETAGTSKVADINHAAVVDPPASFAMNHFGAALSYVKVNEHYVSYSEAEGVWAASPLIARMLRKSVAQLTITVQFKRQSLDFRIPTSTTGHLALRPSNSSVEVLALRFVTQDVYVMTTTVDLMHALDRIQTFTSGPHAVLIRLESPLIQEPLVLTLGEIEVSTSTLKKPFRLRLVDVWDGSFWRKFQNRCETDPAYVSTITTRFKWSELLITLFSVAYCTAVNWLGPLDFTPWQQRCYQISCISSAIFQIAFGAWISDTVSICTAVPPAMSLGTLYFVTFNLLNVLILMEHSHRDDDGEDEEDTRPPSLIRRRPTEPRRMFDSIPSSTQLSGMTRVVMVGYRKARYC